MTRWEREYAVRVDQQASLAGCDERGCTCESEACKGLGRRHAPDLCLTASWPAQEGPYDVTVYHLGFSQDFHEDHYREPDNGRPLHQALLAFLQAGHELRDEQNAQTDRLLEVWAEQHGAIEGVWPI